MEDVLGMLVDKSMYVMSWMIYTHIYVHHYTTITTPPYRHVNDEIRLKKWLEDKEKESESRGR